VNRVAALALVTLALGACERQADESPGPAARPEPVVVYASFEDENYLPSLLAGFTRDTGIPVTVRYRPEHQIVGEVIANKGSPPADLLLTRSIHGIWRAADEGALRPLQSQPVVDAVPDWLRSPDGDWTAIGFDTINIVCSAASRSDCESVASFEDLSEPEFEGQLCLSAPTLAVNKTLIAAMIADHGTRPAERLVRGWISSLAVSPFDSEQALLGAVEAGTCRLAVVSGLAIHEFGERNVAATWPRPGYFDVVAAGIGRHARQPDSARKLAEWLTGEDAQAAQFDAIGLRPASLKVPENLAALPKPARTRNAGVFGFFETEAVKLAERARWY
jgi:iron(III) transport system substrate-binding protein